MASRMAEARLDPGGRQVAAVTVRGGYRPAAIRARAGVPLRVVFRRDDEEACSERVIFSAPRLERRLVAGAATTVDLPAYPAGTIRFTCGMGRYRGRIELVNERPPSVVEWVRARVRPHWLIVGVAAGLVAIGLVVSGAVSLSMMLFIGAFGGMLWMHAGGHGAHRLGGRGN